MYYFLRENLFENLKVFDFDPPSTEDVISRWIEGKKLDSVTTPLICILKPNEGAVFSDFFDSTIPIMSNRLITHLKDLGVINFESYPVVFKHPVSGKEFAEHQAVNFIGKFDAINPEQSPHRLRFGRPKFNGPIVLDTNKVPDQNAFRLEGGPGLLVVTEAVADAIKSKNYNAVLLQPLQDYDGD